MSLPPEKQISSKPPRMTYINYKLRGRPVLKVRRQKGLSAIDNREANFIFGDPTDRPKKKKSLSSRVVEPLFKLYNKGYGGKLYASITGENFEKLIREIQNIDKAIKAEQKRIDDSPDASNKRLKKKIAKLRLQRVIKEKEISDLDFGSVNKKNRIRAVAVINKITPYMSMVSYSGASDILGGFSMNVSPVLSFGQSVIGMPVQVKKVQNDWQYLQHLSRVKKYYRNDPELVAMTEFLENKKFIYSDIANLFVQIPHMILNKLSLGIVGVLGLIGLSKFMNIPFLDSKRLKALKAPVYFISKLSFVLSVCLNIYKFIYFKHQSYGVKNLKKQVVELYNSSKLKEKKKIEKIKNEVIKEAQALGENLSSKETKKRVLQKLNLQLIRKSGKLVAYRLLERLQKEGSSGKTASYLIHIGFHPPGADLIKKYDYIRDVMKLDLSDDESLEVAVTALTKCLGL